MNGGAETPQPSERLIRWVLAAQPQGLRHRYAGEMREMVIDAWRSEASGRGPVTRVRFWIRMLTGGLRLRSAMSLGGDPGSQSPFHHHVRRHSALLDDVRQAWRSVRRRPGFAAAVILSFTLAIGANTAMFSVLDAVLLTPLPYPESEELLRVHATDRRNSTSEMFVTGSAYLDYRETMTSLDGIAAAYTYAPTSVDITDGPVPVRVPAMTVSANYFGVLGVTPLIGRTFEPAEEDGTASVAMLGRFLAESLFGDATSAVGRSVTLDGVAHTVVGVLPTGAVDPVLGSIDVFRPHDLRSTDMNNFDNHYLTVYGRLAPGSTLESARSEFNRRAEAHRTMDSAAANIYVRIEPLQDDLVGSADTTLILMMVGVGLVLLLACVNVSGMALAQGARRERELAVRSSLGAGRNRIGRQLVLESLVLAILGGVLGVVSAPLGLKALLSIAPEGLSGVANAAIDGSVLGFALLATLVAGLVAGVAPSLYIRRGGIGNVLRRGTGDGSHRTRTSLRRLLVGAEIAGAVVLVIGAALLARSLDRIRQVDLRIEPGDVVTFSVALPSARYPTGADRERFHTEFQDRIRRIGGVQSVAAISRLPVTGPFHSWGTWIPDWDPPNQAPYSQANQRVYAGDYFEALGIEVVAGTLPQPGDPPSVVVNRAEAEGLYGEEDPIGRRLQTAGGRLVSIVAVVEDVPISVYGEVVPKVYHPHDQFAENRNWRLTQVVRLDGPSPMLLANVQEALASLDPLLVLDQPQTLPDVLRLETGRERFVTVLALLFAALALGLAFVGVFGVVSESVAQRRREIGIRMALGARLRTVLGNVMREALRVSILGVLFGTAVTLALAGWLRSLVFGVGVRDPGIFAGGAGVLLAIALLAALLPAIRATRVDPVEAFRGE